MAQGATEDGGQPALLWLLCQSSQESRTDLREQKYKALIFSIVSAILGGICISLGSPHEKTWGIYALLLRDVGISLVVTGLIGIMFDIAFKNDFFRELQEKAKITRSVSESKIEGINQRFESLPWGALIGHTKTLYIVGIGAHTWRNTNRDYLQKALSSKGNVVKILLPDPENHSVVNELANLHSVEPDGLL